MAFVRLIAVAKDEAAYLAEWVHHHLYFGFDQITIILNGCTDNSRLLLEQIACHEARLMVRDGDALRATSEQAGQQFQTAAYAQELALARQDIRVTHLMCLDIDEFWVSPELQEGIHDYADRYPEADSIAFAWHMEVPSNPEPFSPALKASYLVQKHNHVKSLNKLSDRLLMLGVHNGEYIDGCYLLADGAEFKCNVANEAARAVLSIESLEASIDQLDSAFIYHRLFRSQLEYLASLQRGRPNNKVQLKDNRWGYRKYSSKTSELCVTHPVSKLEEIYRCYDRFVSKHTLQDLILTAQEFTSTRAHITIAAFNNPTPETNKLNFLIAGVTGLEMRPSFCHEAHIAQHIDSITATDSGFVVKGWAIDRNSQHPVSISVLAELQASVTRLARPDVMAHYPGTHSECGYLIAIERIPSGQLDISFRCGSATSTHTLLLIRPE